MSDKVFPAGFDSWHETHYNIVEALTTQLLSDSSDTYANLIQEAGGHGALYEKAGELTDEFEKKYCGAIWGVTHEYLDEIDKFLDEKFSAG